MKRSLAVPTPIKVAAATVLVAALAGCSTGSTSGTEAAAEPTSTTSVDPDAFPVTIEHALGETTIESEPTRVATLGWTDHDHALALGVVPVTAAPLLPKHFGDHVLRIGAIVQNSFAKRQELDHKQFV